MSAIPPFIVPVRPVPSQVVTTTLSNQDTQLNIYAKDIMWPVEQEIPTDPIPTFAPLQPLFMDVLVNGVLIIGGVLCLNQNLIVRNAYLGFVGDLSFVDTIGQDDPVYTGLGTRWLLTYWPSLTEGMYGYTNP